MAPGLVRPDGAHRGGALRVAGRICVGVVSPSGFEPETL